MRKQVHFALHSCSQTITVIGWCPRVKHKPALVQLDLIIYYLRVLVFNLREAQFRRENDLVVGCNSRSNSCVHA